MSVAEHVVEFPHEGVPVGDHWRERVLDQEVAEPLGRGEMRISVRWGVNRSSRVGLLPKSLAVPQYAVSQFAARSRSSQFAIVAVKDRSRSRR